MMCVILGVTTIVNQAAVEPVISLYGLLEDHSPRMLQEIVKLAAATQASLGQNFMDTLNSVRHKYKVL